MVKISQLPAYAAAIVNDFFALVDSAGNITKKITLNDLLTLLGHGTIPNKYKFSAFKSASNQTVTTGTAQVIVYDVESFDTNSNFASNVYTAPVTGYYAIQALHQVSSAASLTRAILSIYINGVQARERGILASTSANTSVDIAELLLLSAGDQITIRAQAAGASYTSVSGPLYNDFSGYLVTKT